MPKNLVPKALESVQKALRQGGVFYLAVKAGEGERVVKENKLGTIVHRFFSFFTRDEIEKLVEGAGFKITKIGTYKKGKSSTVWHNIYAVKA